MKHFIVLTLIFRSFFGFTQSNEPILKGEIFTTDINGNFFDITNNQIIKYDKNSHKLYSYSNNLLGKISSVDASNPLKIIVFYKDFSKITILDNNLSEWIKEVEINEISLEETSLVCTSYNNSIWFYNPLKFQLYRIENNTITNSSPHIKNLLNIDIQPNFMTEYNNRLYVNDFEKGILVFDIYGTYIKTIPILGLKTFQVKEKFLIYVNSAKQIESYDFLTLEKSTYKPEIYNFVKSVRIENNTIYIVNENNELTIESIQ